MSIQNKAISNPSRLGGTTSHDENHSQLAKNVGESEVLMQDNAFHQNSFEAQNTLGYAL
jgi:hypothetical protein